MSSLKHHIHLIALVALVAASACMMMMSCNYGARKRAIAVSIPPQQWLLEQIAGKRYEVVSLLGEESNPEEYVYDQDIMAIIERSDAYFTIGSIGFEAAIIDKAHTSNPDLRIFNTSAGIDSATNAKHHGFANSHVWASVGNAKKIAANMLKALIDLDRKHKHYYERHYRALIEKLDQLDSELKGKLAPKHGQAFAVWHPSLGHFASEYGLKQVVLEPHTPTPVSKDQLEKAAIAQKATVVLLQDDFDPNNAENLMKQLSLPQAHICTMAYDWDDQMRTIATAIALH